MTYSQSLSIHHSTNHPTFPDTVSSWLMIGARDLLRAVHILLAPYVPKKADINILSVSIHPSTDHPIFSDTVSNLLISKPMDLLMTID